MTGEKQLAKIVGAGNVSSDPSTLGKYSRDISFVSPERPDYIAKPRNSEDIGKLVALAGKAAVPPFLSGWSG